MLPFLVAVVFVFGSGGGLGHHEFEPQSPLVQRQRRTQRIKPALPSARGLGQPRARRGELPLRLGELALGLGDQRRGELGLLLCLRGLEGGPPLELRLV